MTPIRTTLATVLIALLFAASCSDEDLTWEDPIVKQAPCDPELESCLATPVEDTPVEDIPVEDIPVEDIPVEDIPVEDIPVEDMGWRPGSDDTSRLNSPDYEHFQPRKRSEADADEPRGEPVPVNTDVLIGLPWRDAQKMAHDAGWETQMIFVGELDSITTEEFSFVRLRIYVDGGEEAGTVEAVYHG